MNGSAIGGMNNNIAAVVSRMNVCIIGESVATGIDDLGGVAVVAVVEFIHTMADWMVPVSEADEKRIYFISAPAGTSPASRARFQPMTSWALSLS